MDFKFMQACKNKIMEAVDISILPDWQQKTY